MPMATMLLGELRDVCVLRAVSYSLLAVCAF